MSSNKELSKEDKLKSNAHRCLEKIMLEKGLENDRIEETLEMFSFYLSSNKDYKYNMTYINDQIGNFIETMEVFKIKKSVYQKICNDLDRTLVDIEFDNCFSYVFINEGYSLILKKNLENFSIYRYPLKSTFLKIRVKETEEEFTYKIDKLPFSKIKENETKEEKEAMKSIVKKIEGKIIKYIKKDARKN